MSRRLLVLIVVNVVSSGSDANWSGDSELISTSTITEEDDEDLLLIMDGLLKYAIVPQSAKMDRITPAFFGLDMLFVMVLMPKAGGRFERRVVIGQRRDEFQLLLFGRKFYS